MLVTWRDSTIARSQSLDRAATESEATAESTTPLRQHSATHTEPEAPAADGGQMRSHGPQVWIIPDDQVLSDGKLHIDPPRPSEHLSKASARSNKVQASPRQWEPDAATAAWSANATAKTRTKFPRMTIDLHGPSPEPSTGRPTCGGRPPQEAALV